MSAELARRAVQIEAIAAQIAQCWDARDESLAEFLGRENANGWTIDVTYGSEGDGNWTRTEGVRLADDELAEATKLAEQWTATGPWAVTS